MKNRSSVFEGIQKAFKKKDWYFVSLESLIWIAMQMLNFIDCMAINPPWYCLCEVKNGLFYNYWIMISNLNFQIADQGIIIHSTCWLCGTFTCTKRLLYYQRFVEKGIWIIWFRLWKADFPLKANCIWVQPSHNNCDQ